MSFIAEFEVQPRVMREAADAVPDMEFEAQERNRGPEPKFIFWAWGDDYATFEAALEDDPTIASYDVPAEVGSRRLYSIILTESGRRKTTYPDATEYDIVLLEGGQSDGWSRVRARVPSREALKAYRQACAERSVPFRLLSLYRETTEEQSGRFGLTSGQRELVARAHELGYYDEPRGVSLKDLAEEFDVSSSAIGQRLRRAHDTLVSTALDLDH